MSTSVDLPEPETPVTHGSTPSGNVDVDPAQIVGAGVLARRVCPSVRAGAAGSG